MSGRQRGRGSVIAAASLAALVAVTASCSDDDPGFAKISLEPGPNPFGPEHPLWAPQPHREHPYSVVLTDDGAKLYVALQGTEDEPGSEVAVVDTTTETMLGRIEVGSSPTGMALHPDGRFLVVCNRFSNFASIIDTSTDEVVTDVRVPFYTVEAVFTPDGGRAYLSNRWKNSVLRWDLRVDGGSFAVVGDNYRSAALDRPMGIPTGQNPRDLTVSDDGSRLYVAGLAGLTLSIIDTSMDTEIRRIFLNSPPGDVITAGEQVFVTHTGAGTHHPPDEGFDTNGSGTPGDDTANVMFQDLQNELAVFDRDGERLANYTSDTICCADYRDVDPDRPDRGELLPAPDTWPASRVTYLPPRETWIVACALPQQMAVSGDRLLMVCSGSNEVQGFDIGAGGSLTPRQSAGGLYRTGMNPHGVAISPDGRRAYVAERLGEYVSVLDLDSGPGSERRILVGDVADGEFPASDAEIGAAINFVTAPFTLDGDQTCVHCHREGGNLAKAVAMPLQGDTVWGIRMQMAYRGAFDTRPWFIESSMDETNFFPVINEFARKENFCCEQLDPLIWPLYPDAGDCVDDPELPGCNHVLDCRNDPPPECAERPYGSPYPTRASHFRAGAEELLGSDITIGDVLYQEILDDNGDLVRVGVPLDFNGATRALGLFLLQNPRFLPNPNAVIDSPAARRGRLIYESPTTGCATCHPLPTTSLSPYSENPLALPLRFAAVITPRRNPLTGEEVDSVNPLFVGSFPDTEQDAAGLHIGVPQLRGIWDRAEMFLHDGRARSLRETLATPGHAGLLPGEIGYNETYGMPDTHGATSHLSRDELDDLIAFLLTL